MIVKIFLQTLKILKICWNYDAFRRIL